MRRECTNCLACAGRVLRLPLAGSMERGELRELGELDRDGVGMGEWEGGRGCRPVRARSQCALNKLVNNQNNASGRPREQE